MRKCSKKETEIRGIRVPKIWLRLETHMPPLYYFLLHVSLTVERSEPPCAGRSCKSAGQCEQISGCRTECHSVWRESQASEMEKL